MSSTSCWLILDLISSVRVLEYMDDMLDRDSWPVTESRDIKHVARRYRTSALVSLITLDPSP